MANATLLFLLAPGPDGTGSNLAVEVSKQDFYHPKKTGIFNIHLEKLTKSDSQKWLYDSKKKTITSMLHKESVFFEGTNHNISAYKFIGLKNQNFDFDLKKK